MDEEADRPPRELPEEEGSSLSRREQETAGQLRLMDPHLAGLYEQGIRLLRQNRQPGKVYLLAHCGRELSRGVLQLLLDVEGPATSETGQEHRQRISHALHLPLEDPRVDAWYELHSRFCKSVHWRYPGPSADAVHGRIRAL